MCHSSIDVFTKPHSRLLFPRAKRFFLSQGLYSSSIFAFYLLHNKHCFVASCILYLCILHLPHPCLLVRVAQYTLPSAPSRLPSSRSLYPFTNSKPDVHLISYSFPLIIFFVPRWFMGHNTYCFSFLTSDRSFRFGWYYGTLPTDVCFLNFCIRY